MSRAVMQQALEALTLLQGDIEWTSKSPTLKFVNSTVAALRQALAEPKQPVACNNTFSCRCPKHFNSLTPRKPLSLDEIQHCADEAGLLVTKRLRCFARVIEAKLKEKNT